jgi:hypothetical protein
MNETVKIHGLEEVKKTLIDRAEVKFPIAMSKALNMTKDDMRDAIQREMMAKFDRPTPWTLGGFYRVSAKKDELYASVGLKSKGIGVAANKGTPATEYLWPEVYGGGRNMKRFEKALRYAGVLPEGMYCIPPSRNRENFDQYGNLKSGLIIQLISYFKGFREGSGYRMNTTAEKKAKMAKGTKKIRGLEYFVVKTRKGHLHPGIYSKTAFSFGSAIKPIVLFQRAPGYARRLDFFGVGNKVGQEMLERHLAVELGEAVK